MSRFISLSAWRIFSSSGKTPLVRIKVRLSQFNYIDVLKQYVLLLRTQYHSTPMDFIYQHDRCAPHRAESESPFLYTDDVKFLRCTTQIPDHNPIEHVWTVMKQRMRLLNTYTITTDALFTKLCEILNSLPETYFNNLIASMTNRGRTVSNLSGSARKH